VAGARAESQHLADAFHLPGQDAYPLIDEWIATKAEEYWRTHVARDTHDAANVARRGSPVPHVRTVPDWAIPSGAAAGGITPTFTQKALVRRALGRAGYAPGAPVLLCPIWKAHREITRLANDPNADLVAFVGREKTREQIVPIMDGLVNNNEGVFQVNVPNRGALEGIPDDVVVEVPAVVNQKGIQPLRVGSLPQKIMYGHILPDWLERNGSCWPSRRATLDSVVECARPTSDQVIRPGRRDP